MTDGNGTKPKGQHGGRRPGAGRKPMHDPMSTAAPRKRVSVIAAPRIPNEPTPTAAEVLPPGAATGRQPLEFILDIMRNEDLPQADRFEAAKVAAPFCHPRLIAADHRVTRNVVVHVNIGPDDAALL